MMHGKPNIIFLHASAPLYAVSFIYTAMETWRSR